MAADFDITETSEAGCVRLALHGELDHRTAEILESRLRELEQVTPTVRLNLAQVEFMDSSGMSALLRGITRARENGRTLEIERDVSPFIESRVKYLGLAHGFGWTSESAC